MAVSRILAVCLLLAAVREASALAVARPDDAEPDAAGALEADAGGDKEAQLFGFQSDDEAGIGDDGEGITVDIAGCAAEERATLARSLQQRYKEQFESKIEDVFQSVERPAYLTVGESRNKALLRNFLAHVKEVTTVDDVKSTVVAVQLDEDGMAQCNLAALHYSTERLDIHCVNLAGWLPVEFFGPGINAGPWTCVYNMIIWSKPEIFRTAVNVSDHNVLLIDTDVVVYHDMFKLGEEAFRNQTDAKLAVTHEIHGYRNPNTGVVFGTKQGMDMIEWWASENINCVNQFAGDQAAFANLAKFGDNLHFWKQLAVIRVPEVGQCGNRGIWATHYNCLGGKKERVMKNVSDWHEDAWAQLPPNERLAKAQQANLIGQQNVVAAMKASGDWWVTE
ncbi:unnamed protein product [Prorocentrum cordatum]|uniref:Nucleotide-diphospho-sugar transferase domain-containing protein n=1 Tax=Prorocentrum cordatum TaxID=2364126 RepID=A0ABN9TIW3_9DINO|nr:unnamed protein product [Polarella glacialis]